MKRILFVDDEPMVLRGLERSLADRAEEWEMSFVGSGSEALALLAEAPFDVVVSDIRMPKMNGAELLAEVMRRHPAVARIVLSGQADQNLVLQCVGTAHQYLSKPCDPGDLAAAVGRVIELQAIVETDAIRTMVGRLDRLPSCPQVYQKINASLASPHADIAAIGTIVEADIAMTAKLLKLVNSAFFGLSQRVSTAAEAVSYLGIEVLKALVLTMQFFDQCRYLERAGLHVDTLWRRSMLTARAARALVREEKLPRSVQEEAFTAGMLHHCGLLVLADNLPSQLGEVIARARREKVPLSRLERETFGTTHAEVGGYLLGLWGLPMSIVTAVAQHAHGERAEPGATPELLVFVHAAHALVGQDVATIEGVPVSPPNWEGIAAAGYPDREARWQDAVAASLAGD